MSFNCRACGSPLVQRHASGARAVPAPRPLAPMAPAMASAEGVMENPYAMPQAAAMHLPWQATGSQALASRSSRLAAALIDVAVVFAAFLPLFAVSGPDRFALPLIITVLAVGSLAIYQLRLLVSHGQSIGKRAMKIRIVNYDDGALPTAGKLLGMRVFVNNLLCNIVPLYAFADPLFIFGTEQRCLHDYLAGTKVVEA